MEELSNIKEISEIKTQEVENYKQIKPEGNISIADARNFWDNLFKEAMVKAEIDKQKEVSESREYLSTYMERIIQTPAKETDRGRWEGKRGESIFIPNDPEIKSILDKCGLDGIEYEDGIPDFSKASEATVEIDNMTENRPDNFKQCDEKCVEQWNKEGRDGRMDWTAREVKEWRQCNGYSWHERNDMKQCDLVPTRVNDYFGHLGGVSECKKRDSSYDGGDFDE